MAEKYAFLKEIIGLSPTEIQQFTADARSLGMTAAEQDCTPYGALAIRLTQVDPEIVGVALSTVKARRSSRGRGNPREHAEARLLDILADLYGDRFIEEEPLVLASNAESCDLCSGHAIAKGIKRFIFGAHGKKSEHAKLQVNLGRVLIANAPQIEWCILHVDEAVCTEQIALANAALASAAEDQYEDLLYKAKKLSSPTDPIPELPLQWDIGLSNWHISTGNSGLAKQLASQSGYMLGCVTDLNYDDIRQPHLSKYRSPTMFTDRL